MMCSVQRTQLKLKTMINEAEFIDCRIRILA